MAYTIVITKTDTVIKKTGPTWEKSGQIQKQDMFNEDKTYLSDTYDYTPMVEKWTTVETKVLEQTVEEMDLAAVIKAINAL